MKAYWSHLNDRERWMLGFGGVCCFFFLLYILLFAPLLNAVQNKSQQFIEKQETLAWMQRARLQYHTAEAPQALSSGQLLSVLAEKLKSSSFHRFPYQLQQTGASDIQLSFDQVPYNAFVTWLWTVGQKYAFLLSNLMLNVRIRLGLLRWW